MRSSRLIAMVLLAASSCARPAAPTPMSPTDAKALFNTGSNPVNRRRGPSFARPRFEKSVFDAEVFPKFDYEDPAKAREFAGAYHFDISFYDDADQKVAHPEGPGAYRAVVTVTSGAGDSYTVYRTLYRVPYAHEQRTNTEDERAAILLAHAAATRPSELTAEASREQSKRWHELRRSLGKETRYEFAVVTPEGYDADAKKTWPTIVWLHGGGAVPKPLDVMKVNVIKSIRQDRKDWPFIVVIPRSLGFWEPWAINDVLDEVQADYRVDPDRVYLIGYSLGGYGTWLTAFTIPERFAAISPAGSWGEQSQVERIKDLPTWMFQGENDNLNRAMGTVDALQEVNARFRYTIIPGADHGQAYASVYHPPFLYEWLLKQKRGQPAELRWNDQPVKGPTTTQPVTQPAMP